LADRRGRDPATAGTGRGGPAGKGAGPPHAAAAAAGLDRAANLFGALSQVVADQSADAVGEAAGRSQSAAAALSALLHFLDRPSVDLLRQVLGLTSSGTVRLLDRLEEGGHVERGPGTDGRSSSIALTESGRRAARRVTDARAAVLAGALSVLSPAEREVFEQLTGKVLVGMMRGPGAVRWICRLCDIGTCRGADGGCPVGNTARERYLAQHARH
jgi:DNA-binding MarR family transcriptional regulator